MARSDARAAAGKDGGTKAPGSDRSASRTGAPQRPAAPGPIDLPWCEPIDAYRLLRDRGAVLFDGSGQHPDARRAFIAFTPAWQASLRGTWHVEPLDVGDPPSSVSGTAGAAAPATAPIRSSVSGRSRRTDPAGATGPVHWPAEPLAALRAIVDAALAVGPERPQTHGFTGGLVGYFGYGFASVVEPTLPSRQDDTPDAWLRLCRDAVSFDRTTHTVTLHVHDLPGEDGAAARARDIAAAWRQAAPHANAAPATLALPGEAAGSGKSGHVGDGEGVLLAAPPASLDETMFQERVSRLRDLIAAGDLFQANLATRFTAPCAADPCDLFAALAASNPSPFMALMEAGDHAIVSCSPELLMRVEDGTISTRPIAGTRKRGITPEADAALEAELLADAKEQAEHTMLVDLLRNDVAKVAVAGTVHVPERMSVERYRHVMHLVSRVEAKVRPETGFVDWLCALFPGGTITGAPKHRACLRIHEAEEVPRGPYTGSAGYVAWSGDAQWNILIRTIVLKDGQARVHAGSGIVADSDPRREWKEAQRKARALLDAAAGSTTPAPLDVGRTTAHGAWRPRSGRHVPGRRVLVIDNYDSFTFNLVDALAARGAAVEVVRNDADWQMVAAALKPTHIVLSPGPGRPEHSVATLDVLESPMAATTPVLGVCLGHQAMGHATGARIVVGHPVHGKTAEVVHDGGLLAGLPSPFLATRYHSLAVDPATLPAAWRPTAWLQDGTLMAMEHRARPWFGLQFHPESLCTDVGVEILARFLEVEHGRHRVR